MGRAARRATVRARGAPRRAPHDPAGRAGRRHSTRRLPRGRAPARELACEPAASRQNDPLTSAVDPERLARREAARRDLGRRRRRALLGVAAIPLIVLVWFLVSLFQPFHGDGSGNVTVTIPRDAGVGDIAKLLDQKGVISSRFFFEARATLSGDGGDLKAGTYGLKRGMSYGSVLGILTAGPHQSVVTVTVPEGLSRREIAALAARDGLKGNYAAATVRSRLIDPARYGGKQARSLEGFLFPATYEVPPGSVNALVAKQLVAF